MAALAGAVPCYLTRLYRHDPHDWERTAVYPGPPYGTVVCPGYRPEPYDAVPLPAMRSGDTLTLERTVTVDLLGERPTTSTPWHVQLTRQLDHLDRPATLLVDPEPGRSRLYVATLEDT